MIPTASAAELVQHLRDRGFRFQLNGDGSLDVIPEARITPEIDAAIKAVGATAIRAAIEAESDIEDPAGASGDGRRRPGAPDAPPPDGLALRKLSTYTRRTVEWLWYPYLALGKATLLVGDPDVGKSFVENDLTTRVTAGTTWPTGEPIGEPGNVVIVSAEDDPEDTILPRIEDAGGNPDRVWILDGRYRGGQLEAFVLDQVDLLRDVVEKTQARLINIDPYTAYLGRDVNEWKNAEVRGRLAPLKRFIETARVAALLISHLNKGTATKVIYRIQGSIAHVAAPRICYAVLRGLGDDRERRYVCKVKLNIALSPPPLSFRFSTPAFGTQLPVVAWEPGRVAVNTVDELFAGEVPQPPPRPPLEREPEKQAAAAAFIEAQLAKGPVKSTALRDAAKQSGVSWHTVERAKARAGERLLVAEVGRGTEDQTFYWYLPAHARAMKALQDRHPPKNDSATSSNTPSNGGGVAESPPSLSKQTEIPDICDDTLTPPSPGRSQRQVAESSAQEGWPSQEDSAIASDTATTMAESLGAAQHSEQTSGSTRVAGDSATPHLLAIPVGVAESFLGREAESAPRRSLTPSGDKRSWRCSWSRPSAPTTRSPRTRRGPVSDPPSAPGGFRRDETIATGSSEGGTSRETSRETPSRASKTIPRLLPPLAERARSQPSSVRRSVRTWCSRSAKGPGWTGRCPRLAPISAPIPARPRLAGRLQPPRRSSTVPARPGQGRLPDRSREGGDPMSEGSIPRRPAMLMRRPSLLGWFSREHRDADHAPHAAHKVSGPICRATPFRAAGQGVAISVRSREPVAGGTVTIMVRGVARPRPPPLPLTRPHQTTPTVRSTGGTHEGPD